MTVILNLTVPGEPVPKARPRVVNGHAYTDARTAAAEQKIGWLAKEALGGGFEPVRGPVHLSLRFMRKSRRRADCDNFQKLVQDALNGIVWVDDFQVIGWDGTIKQTEGKQEPWTDIRVIEVLE